MAPGSGWRCRGQALARQASPQWPAAASQRAAKAPKVQPPYAYSPPVPAAAVPAAPIEAAASQFTRSAPPAAPQAGRRAAVGAARQDRADAPLTSRCSTCHRARLLRCLPNRRFSAAPDPSAVAPAVIAEAPSTGPPDGQSAATAQLPQPEFGGPVQPSATAAPVPGPRRQPRIAAAAAGTTIRRDHAAACAGKSARAASRAGCTQRPTRRQQR